jgi:uncharacterized membrane protein YuzA (DUF378 family)
VNGKKKYYIATLLFGLFSIVLQHAIPSYYSLLTIASYVLCGIATIYCVVRIFNINHKADDKNFIERLTCFGLPAIVRAFTFNFIVAYIYYAFSVNVSIPFVISTFMHLILAPATYILMFYYIGYGFRALHA